jgi:uncharacterized lipoprotein YajG
MVQERIRLARLHLVSTAMASILLAGCAKRPEPTSLDAAPPQPAQAQDTSGTTEQAANTAAPVTAIHALSTADSAEVLTQLTQALRKFSAENRRVPATFEEFLGPGYQANLPKAPPGKKYAVNPKRVEVVLVNSQ